MPASQSGHETGICEFLVLQVVREDKMRMGHFFYYRLWWTKGKIVQQSFSTNLSLFSIRLWTHWTTVGSVCPPQCGPILIKTKLLFHIMVFGIVTNDGDIIPHIIFPYILRFDTEAYIKCLGEVVPPGLRRGLPEDLTFGNMTLCHAMQAEEPSLTNQKIWAITSPQILKIAIPLIIMCGALLCEKPTKRCATPKNWRQR